MARIFPFRAYRYSQGAGDPARLLTQPYDKISEEMQERYFSLSPYNIAHVIRGRIEPDCNGDNVYTRAARYFDNWIAQGILIQEAQPAFFAYFQKFRSPDDGRTYERKGLIALGAVEDYAAGTVYRHELTHAGPKADRLELLRHTHAHYGQLFMLYDDPDLAVDARLDEAAGQGAVTSLEDEYGAEHRLWRISDPAAIADLQRLIAPRRLLIADGHHRYETAIAFRNENAGLPGAAKVMMTLVNMRSPGLVVLATHRVVDAIPDFDPRLALSRAGSYFTVEGLATLEALKARMDQAAPGGHVLGAGFRGDRQWYCFEAADRQVASLLPDLSPAERHLDVVMLHRVFLSRVLGLSDDAVREATNIRYVRGFETASADFQASKAQAVFFLRPVPVLQVAEVAFGGGIMPQKSTDFYPKLLSGITIYKIEEPSAG